LRSTAVLHVCVCAHTEDANIYVRRKCIELRLSMAMNRLSSFGFWFELGVDSVYTKNGQGVRWAKRQHMTHIKLDQSVRRTSADSGRGE